MPIRPAMPADLAALLAVDPLARAGSERAGDIVEWMRSGTCFVAQRDQAIAGYAAFSTHFFHQRFLELVMVGEAYRRQGIGRALVQHILDLAPAGKLWTSTNESNAPMRELLARMGFVPSGRVDNLDPGDPELIFVHLPKVTPVEPAAR